VPRKRKRQTNRLGKTFAVKIIPPTKPEARDEGPRLLPLERKPQPESKLEHYMSLANIALKNWN
jgi:hypothetical protein